ncbi:MAG: lipoyl synthase [Deltaproteobacteria bacterium]|nr:lipoyl synthase [Deltaproteobacteria bacterium]
MWALNRLASPLHQSLGESRFPLTHRTFATKRRFVTQPNAPQGRIGRLPPWLKKSAGDYQAIHALKSHLRARRLTTVCEEARCPNIGECFSRGTATFMICGEVCTRACRFCAVQHGRGAPLDPDEPRHVAEQVAAMGLHHVVVTSVARDDLPDEGAAHFAATIHAIRAATPSTTIEVLVPDFHDRTDCLQIVGVAAPDIFNHNLETVRRLTPQIRSKARYDRSLAVLQHFKTLFPQTMTKSGLMVGLGESPTEMEQALRDLRDVGCDVVTIGQYLQPTAQHYPVAEFVPPAQFAQYQQFGAALGFRHVFSGPFVRSSYMAESQWIRAKTREE